jgi:Cu-processing system ATP-binding protein
MIQIKKLSKTYKRQKVLQGVDLTIPSGSLFSLLGPNGSGKTTLLKSILGTVIPDPGTEILVEGRSIRGNDHYKRELSYMPQAPKFPPHLKVKEMIQLILRLRKQRAVHKDQLMEDLGIGLFWNKALGELSGGMTQKVNILQSFMFDTPICILDEPTLGLDPQVTFYLKRWVKKLNTQGKTVLFTSHIMAEVEELAQQMALLVEGKLYMVISPEQLKKEKSTPSLEEALHQFWTSIANHEKVH